MEHKIKHGVNAHTKRRRRKKKNGGREKEMNLVWGSWGQPESWFGCH